MEDQCARYRDRLVKPETPPFATIIPTRHPGPVKVHRTLGQARSAVGYGNGRFARGGEIYRLEGDEWTLIERVERGTPVRDLPWRKGKS
jgi:hypothetical protein